MDRLAVLVAALLLAPLAAGCLSEEEPTQDGPVVAQDAEAAGAKSGEAPVAPKDAYTIDGGAAAYPVAVETNPARAPITIDFSGEFKQQDCRMFNFGGAEEILMAASYHRRFRSLEDDLKVGDVFSYNITLTYTNSAQNWGEIHMAYGIGSTIQEHIEPTRELTDVVQSYSGQGYRGGEDDMAWLFVGCDIGAMQTPIPYTFTATFTFAEGAVPAEAPMLLTVPEGATKLFVTGVKIDDTKGTLSHFRVFRPDDTLLCECALSSSEDVATVEIPEAGEYVVIVDHTDNGFLSFALDAPSDTPLRALGAEWVETSLFAADNGPVDQTVDVTLDRVPLVMFAAVVPKDSAGVGKRTSLVMANARGEPLRIAWGGHVTWSMPDGGMAWTGIWPTDWEFTQDHHAYAQGAHTATIKAEELRGEIFLVTRQYVR